MNDANRERLLQKYRTVTQERLDRLNNAFLQLQSSPDDLRLTQELMREIHTLKGEARMMGLNPISVVAHRTEDLLQRARDAHFERGSEINVLVLAGYDLIAHLLTQTDATRAEEEARDFAAAVAATLRGEHVPAAEASGARAAPPGRPKTADTPPPAQAAAPPAAQTSGPQTPPAAAPPATPAGGNTPPTPKARRDSIRVDTRKIEQITDITGDLVLGQTRLEAALRDLTAVVDDWRRTLANLRRQGRAGQRSLSQQQIAQMVAQMASKLSTVDEVNHRLMRTREDVFSARVLLDDLETRVRELRLVPLSTLFGRMPRAIYDMAKEQGKQVRVVVSGNDIAVDADVLDKLGDPLVHLLRNCVDHGIETPDERIANAKPAEGVINLQATQKGSHVEIVVRDDGRGMDPGKLVETAVFRGFVSAREAEGVSRDQALSWIFKPGFSTRDHITDISGRGVGLDAVWQQLSSMGGTVEYETLVGQGTSFKLLAPVSTVLSRALVLSAADGYFAITSESVVMALAVDEHQVEQTAGGQVLRVGDERMGVTDLASLFSGGSTPAKEGQFFAVVLQLRGVKRAFLVQELVGERQVIQRQLDPFCEHLSFISGTALLDGGGLALLLNVNELMQTGSVGHRPEPPPPALDAPLVLVVDDSEMTRDMVVSLLRSRGYRVREAVDGVDALNKAREEVPSLILTDLEMPRCNGFELLRTVRHESKLQQVPVVVFSTLGADSDKKRAADLGANAYIVKTHFKEDELVAVVERHLAHTTR